MKRIALVLLLFCTCCKPDNANDVTPAADQSKATTAAEKKFYALSTGTVLCTDISDTKIMKALLESGQLNSTNGPRHCWQVRDKELLVLGMLGEYVWVSHFNGYNWEKGWTWAGLLEAK